MNMAAQADVIDVRKFRWERLKDMPTARVYTVSSYADGKLYVLGELVMQKTSIKPY